MMGMVSHLKQHKTKKGDLMCFSVLSDETASIDLVIMPNLYKNLASSLKKGSLIKVSGKTDKPNSCLANRIEFISVNHE